MSKLYVNPLPRQISEPMPIFGLDAAHILPFIAVGLVTMWSTMLLPRDWLGVRGLIVFGYWIFGYVVLRIIGIFVPRGTFVALWSRFFEPRFYNPHRADFRVTPYLKSKG